MKIEFYGDGSIDELAKVALTIFPDAKQPGIAECYVDIVSAQSGTFRIVFDESDYIHGSIESCGRFYSDVEVCSRLLTKYVRLPNQCHQCSVGGDTFIVEEHEAVVVEVTPPERRPRSTALAVNVGPPANGGKVLGVWLHWRQQCNQIDKFVKCHWQFRAATNRIAIKNLYLYIVLPVRYRLVDGGVLRSPIWEHFHDAERGRRESSQELLQETKLDHGFPVYQEWKHMFSGRNYLHERRQVELLPLEQVEIRCHLSSDEVSYRNLLLTYSFGLLFAASASLYANSLFALASERHWTEFPFYCYVGSGLGALGAALIGWFQLVRTTGRISVSLSWPRRVSLKLQAFRATWVRRRIRKAQSLRP